ncbi:histone deacetylase 6 isoform X1 [Microplitis demolitor]|uniref:histone deacetylase 6 isoform X1 n=2 Tax=Microplitis demolitor TaxID=69319 RepID=UPI0004CD44A1|nr:histone deacetylase 6 isoform X1 [Microplitis demolitor]XP_053595684.1 histone deacetylase 6 isoform X1 [Microplitis demolitor]
MSGKQKSWSSNKNKSSLSKVKPSSELIAAKKKAAAEHKLKLQQTSQVPDTNFIHDIYQSAMDSRDLSRKDTGLVYDNSMAEHECLWDKNYPECPKRLTRTLERCNELGLISRCKLISPRLATDKELLQKHTQKQIDILKATDGCTDLTKLEELSSRYDAIYIHPSTYKLSRLATGSTINLLQSICRGEVQNGMAIIRPPGHHAMKSEYCGYCFFNNVGIAVESMLRDNLAKKVLIVDWDVHHGQATQQMFYEDPRVVYFSIHRYEQGEFWPNLRESDYHYVGEGAGIGHNFNIPLNKTGMTNADYLAIFQQVLLPMAYEYQPDLVVISAGYDAALGCPEGEMKITPAFYAHLLSQLLGLASGKVAVVLEGGYCLESLSESAALTLRCLLGDPCPMISSLEAPSLSIRDTILNVIYAQKPYWSCYEYQDIYSIHSEDIKEECERHLPAVVFKGTETKPAVYETRNCYPVQSEIFLNDIRNQLISLQLTTNLIKSPNRVCLVYDERMLKHCNPCNNSHPEQPQRITGIFSKHEEYDLLKRCYRIPGRVATEEELLLVHTELYVQVMKGIEKQKMSEVIKQSHVFESVYLHTETWSSACIAVGSVLQVVDSVLNGESQSGVAIVRPPGHHAERDAACGFCIFNNVSIAARYAVEFHGCKRVLILDWDVHHGNGTQAIFEDDPKVLYISIHRYDNGSFFPSSVHANYNVVGNGKGEGFNVNIPWNRKKMGDTEYIAAFQQIIMPIAYQFNPELILVSAGFDACIGDPLGGYSVSPVAYGHFTHWLSSLANGRLILILEGGYNVNSISYSMTMCTKALLGDPLAPITRSTAALCTSAITSIKNVLKTHKRYWPNLVFQAALPKENVIPQPASVSDKIYDVSPGAESKILQEEWQSEKNKIHELAKEMKGLNVNQSEHVTKCPTGADNLQKAKPEEEKPGSSSSYQEVRPGSSKMSSDPPESRPLVDSLMFAIIPLSDCPHLELIADVPPQGIDINSPCKECNSTAENWICLHCYSVNCARNINQHAILHGQNEDHPMTLSFTDLSVWCYGCEAYVDNPRLHAAKSAAYLNKFNEELPWTYDEPRIEM